MKKLGELKDAIGEWHDWEELAAEVLEHDGSCEFLRDLKRIERVKLERARSLAYDVRQTYLDSQNVAADSKEQAQA